MRRQDLRDFLESDYSDYQKKEVNAIMDVLDIIDSRHCTDILEHLKKELLSGIDDEFLD